MSLEVVPAAARQWSEEDQQAVVEGMQATERTVPAVDSVEGALSFLILRDGRPIGIFMVIPKGDAACEVGARFWERTNNAARLMGRGLAVVLERYEYALARVYASNGMVRRLLQRAGFTLLDVVRQDGRTVHVYGVKREDYLRLANDAGVL